MIKPRGYRIINDGYEYRVYHEEYKVVIEDESKEAVTFDDNDIVSIREIAECLVKVADEIEGKK